MAETKTVALPSGKTAVVRDREPTGDDLIKAYRVLPRRPNPGEISIALLAQLVMSIDGAPAIYESVRAMSLADLTAMMAAAGLAESDEENPTSPPPPSSPDSSSSALN
jgi:hypothetical protein